MAVTAAVTVQIGGDPFRVDVELDGARNFCSQQGIGELLDGQVLPSGPDEITLGGDPQRRTGRRTRAMERCPPAEQAFEVWGWPASVDQQVQVLANRDDWPAGRGNAPVQLPMSVDPSEYVTIDPSPSLSGAPTRPED